MGSNSSIYADALAYSVLAGYMIDLMKDLMKDPVEKTVEATKRETDRICQENLEAIRLKEAQARRDIARQAEVTQAVGAISDRILSQRKTQSDLHVAQERMISDAKIEIAKIQEDYDRKMARISTDLEKFQISRIAEYKREKDTKIAELMAHLHKSQLDCCNAEHETNVLEAETDLLKKKLEHKRKLKAQKAGAMEATQKVDDDYRQKMRHIVERAKRLVSEDGEWSQKLPKELLTKLSAHFAQSRDGDDDDLLAGDIAFLESLASQLSEEVLQLLIQSHFAQ